MSDTRNDYRILVAEHAVSLLENIVRARRIPIPVNWHEVEALVSELRSLIVRIKYSFIPPTMLAGSEEVERVREYAGKLAKTLLSKERLAGAKLDSKTRMAIAEARYALRTLYGLGYRLSLGDENDALHAVDIECVEVLTITKHPSAEKLFVTRARGVLGYTIVTNLPDVRKGELRAAAILPPREFYGEISEAMYCSGPLNTDVCKPGRRPPANLIDRGSVEAVIYNIVGRKAR
ncbi:RNA-binding protein [Hyperthermus butylicus]|uniref:RNA-binding protein, C-terminal EMAP domain n=1 Tax=Hyperthermus butylicus (strain DSM 5456 / JCM 9403 / PLM1-5) TaxID=415426 RepID=A2BJS3_HYPBU|nr:RNA-binding protein [Hyperthermus butylicus]ABM80234.1 putative RNA-binding protein, C-terminal EMAP domain [Hyperthermus butylicus DSM 5456]